MINFYTVMCTPTGEGSNRSTLYLACSCGRLSRCSLPLIADACYPVSESEVLVGVLEPQRMADSVVAFQSMLKEAFLSFDIAIDIDSKSLPQLSPWQRIDFLVLTAFHYLFVLLVNTLMMNLLIAMLSDTYGDAVRHADKTWRIDRARRVLRLEVRRGHRSHHMTSVDQLAT